MVGEAAQDVVGIDARRKISAWKTEYNSRRPYSWLTYRTPDEFARQ
jgi:transposase InsO family protein